MVFIKLTSHLSIHTCVFALGNNMATGKLGIAIALQFFVILTHLSGQTSRSEVERYFVGKPDSTLIITKWLLHFIVFPADIYVNMYKAQ